MPTAASRPAQIAAAVLVLAVAGVSTDTGIGQLPSVVQELTDTLLAQKDEFATLLDDADLALRTITDQRDAVGAMFADVNEMTAATTRFLSEHGPRFDTLLDQLQTISEQLTLR
ncbi:hypothetical protein [Amycolatopsis sp. YIM 10]|uniref:hypothetical protein n=1 Tax=Amycolatopsis sp. YIM 10 TaxID=2653857 RepID=UPI00128FED11|nr:hypothetical protein [Amycolatopsis sp. YIM 10]QFU90850.1 hypothetical protein YIM_28380 [Amycolatopsis sp. YIM 10]